MFSFKRFYPFLKPYVPRMIAAAVMVMAVAAINLALLRLGGTLWDVITVQHDAPRMTNMILLLLGLVLIQGLCSMGHSYLTAWVSQRVMADFPDPSFAHLETLSVNFFSKRRTGELMSRLMNDVTVIQNVVTDTPIDAAKQIVTFIGGAGFLFAMNWQLCLLILVLLPMLVVVAKLFGRRLRALSTKIQDQTATVSTLVEEVIAGIRVVKSFVQTKREEERFVTQVQSAMELSLRRATIMAWFVPTIIFVTFAAAASSLRSAAARSSTAQSPPATCLRSCSLPAF